MLFLKSLLFIVWNIAWGLALVYFLRWFLFNSKARYFFGKRNILTPGLIVRKREWLFVKHGIFCTTICTRLKTPPWIAVICGLGRREDS